MKTQGAPLPLTLALVAGLALHAPASARPAGGGEHECAACKMLSAPFDPATGRDPRNFARNAGVDFRHMKLELTVLDMNVPVVQGKQTLTLVPLARPARTLTLDANLLAIKRVTVDGRETSITHDGSALTLTFDPPLAMNEPAEIVTTYEVHDPPRGLFWTPENPAWPGRASQIHSQGQPETNSSWFPCHDFPNDKLTTELIVTAPQGYEVSSNGRLASRETTILNHTNILGETSLAPYDVWHWVQSKPHVNYLVTLVIGKFDVVDVGTPALAMPVYAPVGRGNDARATYVRTGPMVEHFGKLLSEPYPWDRYAQLIVWNFAAGGMENTSATTLYDTAIISANELDDHDLDGLISHELAHQWFGDLMTCNTWEHIWLNEGWATYMTHLWWEERDGTDAYTSAVRSTFDGVIAADQGALPETPGMSSKIYSDPWETFRRSANPYGKGAAILHMLRTKMGDAPFFAGVASYIDEHKFKTVDTGDFRKSMEKSSGESLQQFFTQWCTRPNIPRVTVEATWDASTRSLTLHASQTQTIDGLNPAFEFTLPVWVHEPGGPSEWQKSALTFNGRETSVSISLINEPESIAFDPQLTVLCDVTCTHDAARSPSLMASGPTLNARIQGLRGMNEQSPDAALTTAHAIARDQNNPVALRVEAVKGMARAKSIGDLTSLLSRAVDAWEVREAGMTALADLSKRTEASDTHRQKTYAIFENACQQDESTKVRAAAIRGFGTMGARAAMGPIRSAAGTDSQDDDLRNAAIDALITLDGKDGFEIIVSLTKEGVLSRTRPNAIAGVVKLAHHDKDKAFNLIAPLLADRESRARKAAGQALVDLADPRGIPALQSRLKDVRDPDEVRQLRAWLAALSATLGTTTPGTP
jgi:aminopeptidase N